MEDAAELGDFDRVMCPKGEKCIPGWGEAVAGSVHSSLLVTRRARKPREGRPVLGGAGRCRSSGGEKQLLTGLLACSCFPATPPQPSASRGAAAEGRDPVAPRGCPCSRIPAGSRRYLREGWITLLPVPARPGLCSPATPGFTWAQAGGPRPRRGVKAAFASRALLTWVVLRANLRPALGELSG